jgi:hypothetical protein
MRQHYHGNEVETIQAFSPPLVRAYRRSSPGMPPAPTDGGRQWLKPDFQPAR